MRQTIGFCVLGLLVSCLVGCGEDLGRQSVYGEVTLDGEPVNGGNISLAPQPGTQGHTCTATIDEAGNYEIGDDAGPTIGSYRVGVTWKKPTGEKSVDQASGITMDITAEAIPLKFNARTELVVEIAAGSNEHNFALKTTE
jgi:hypothetical protein